MIYTKNGKTFNLRKSYAVLRAAPSPPTYLLPTPLLHCTCISTHKIALRRFLQVQLLDGRTRSITGTVWANDISTRPRRVRRSPRDSLLCVARSFGCNYITVRTLECHLESDNLFLMHYLYSLYWVTSIVRGPGTRLFLQVENVNIW